MVYIVNIHQPSGYIIRAPKIIARMICSRWLRTACEMYISINFSRRVAALDWLTADEL